MSLGAIPVENRERRRPIIAVLTKECDENQDSDIHIGNSIGSGHGGRGLFQAGTRPRPGTGPRACPGTGPQAGSGPCTGSGPRPRAQAGARTRTSPGTGTGPRAKPAGMAANQDYQFHCGL